MQQITVRKPLFGATAIVSATLLYGFFGILTRMAGFTLPLFFLTWTRNLAGAVLILVPLWLAGQLKPLKIRDLFWLVGRTLSGILAFVTSYYAFYYLPIGTAYFMFFGGSTLGGFLLGKFLFQESLNRLKITALFLALIGLLLVYSISVTSVQIWYLWLAFASGLGAGLWNTLSKKVSDGYSAIQLNGLDFLITGLVTLVISFGFKEAWSWPTLTQPWIANGLFLAMFAAAGQLVIIGFKNLDAQRGSLLMLMEIVFGIILSSLIFHERLSFLSLIGGSMIVLAAALPELGELSKLWWRPKNRNSELFRRAVTKKSALG